MRRQGLDLAYLRRREAEGRERDDRREPARQSELVSWDERAGERFPRAVILGDPGLGKTWLLRFEARHLARTMAAQLRSQDIGVWEGRVPIFARLADVASTLRGIENAWRQQGRPAEVPLEDALIALIPRDDHKSQQDSRGTRRATAFSEAFFGWIGEQLTHQRCALMLDALDEVPDDLYETLQHSLRRFAERHPHSRLLLTSRSAAYRGTPVEGVQELELVGFNSAQQRAFIRVR